MGTTCAQWSEWIGFASVTKDGQVTERQWHHIWMDQCDTAEDIRLRYGLEAAFDNAVGEKLLHFFEAATQSSDFARELPRFVSPVKSMFTAEENQTHFARIERERREAVLTEGEIDALDFEAPGVFAERARPFALVKKLLTAPVLGIS